MTKEITNNEVTSTIDCLYTRIIQVESLLFGLDPFVSVHEYYKDKHTQQYS